MALSRWSQRFSRRRPGSCAAMTCLIQRLVAELEQEAARLAASRAVAVWARAEPALRSARTLPDVIAACHDSDRRRANDALAALLRVGATDRLARRAALGALAPGLGAAARRLSA